MTVLFAFISLWPFLPQFTFACTTLACIYVCMYLCLHVSTLFLHVSTLFLYVSTLLLHVLSLHVLLLANLVSGSLV